MKRETCFGVAACIIKNEKILLLHRITDFDVWDPPGGAIEFGESPEEGAVREVKEETDLTVKSEGVLTISSHMTPQGDHHIWFYYLCKILEGEIKILDKDHDEYEWFTFDEVEKLPNLALNVKHILTELKKVM